MRLERTKNDHDEQLTAQSTTCHPPQLSAHDVLRATSYPDFLMPFYQSLSSGSLTVTLPGNSVLQSAAAESESEEM